MALENFQYTKTWESADDFPTIETDETQVRADIQCLYDEIAAGLNALITALNAGGIDTAQLKDGAVTTDKLSLDVRAAIAEKELYWATYGSSNGLDIYTAVTANHLPAVKYSGRTYILSDQFVDVGSGYFNFVFTALTDGGRLYYVVCNQTTLHGLSWTNGSLDLSNVFIAEHGVTQIADIEAAYQAGKAIFCAGEVDGETVIIPLIHRRSSTWFDFAGVIPWLIYDTSCTNQGWQSIGSSYLPRLQYSGTPAAPGTADRGTSTQAARADHVHPLPWTPPANDGTYVLKCVKSGSTITYSWEAQT